MINTKKIKNLFAVIVATVAISSCSSDESNISMASDKGIAKIKELIKANVNPDEYKIYSLSWKENDGDRKLDNLLSRIDVRYLDKNDNDYDISIILEKGKYVPQEARMGKPYYSYKLTTPIDVEGLNAENIRKTLIEGSELVNLQEQEEQYEFRSIESIKFSLTPPDKNFEKKWDKWKDEEKTRYKQVKQEFELNFTKKGDRDKVIGKRIVTNYYTIPFVVDETGKVKIGQ